MCFSFFVEPDAQDGQAHTCNGVKYPEPVILGMFVDDHVTAYLSRVEAIVPDLQQADGLVGNDMEDEDIERMVADIDEKLFESVVMFIEPTTEVIGHQET